MKIVTSHWIRILKHILRRVRHRVSFSVSDLSVFPSLSFGYVFPIFGYECVCVCVCVCVASKCVQVRARVWLSWQQNNYVFLPAFQFTCQLSFHPRYAINYHGWYNRLQHEHSLVPILHLKHTGSFLDDLHFLRVVSNVNYKIVLCVKENATYLGSFQ